MLFYSANCCYHITQQMPNSTSWYPLGLLSLFESRCPKLYTIKHLKYLIFSSKTLFQFKYQMIWEAMSCEFLFYKLCCYITQWTTNLTCRGNLGLLSLIENTCLKWNVIWKCHDWCGFYLKNFFFIQIHFKGWIAGR